MKNTHRSYDRGISVANGRKECLEITQTNDSRTHYNELNRNSKHIFAKYTSEESNSVHGLSHFTLIYDRWFKFVVLAP
jgi:predicted nucleotidyltransferase